MVKKEARRSVKNLFQLSKQEMVVFVFVCVCVCVCISEGGEKFLSYESFNGQAYHLLVERKGVRNDS